MSIATAFLIETAVAIAILRWLWGKKRGEKLSLKRVLTIVFLSLPGVFIGGFVEHQLMNNAIVHSLPPLLAGIIVSVFVTATCEELIKYAALRWVISHEPKIVSHLDVLLTSIMVAMGFTLFENYVYLPEGTITLIRIFLPFHLLFGAIMGYYYGKARVTGKKIYHFLALALPIPIHAIFDLFPVTKEYLPQDTEAIDALTSLPYETDELIIIWGTIIACIAFIPSIIKVFRKIHQWSRNDELQESIRA